MFFRLTFFCFWLSLLCSCTLENTADRKQADTAKIQWPDFSSVHTSNVFVYECGDSLTFTTHLTKDSTWLFLADTSLKLEPVPSASGAKFLAGPYFYWSKGDRALLQVPGESLRSCNTVPQEKSWAAAKLRGADFRAVGQEPGWYLEVTGRRVSYVGSYGQDTVATTLLTEPKKQKGQKIYNSMAGGSTLQIDIEDKLCIDSMNGFEFPATVSVTINGNTFHGCGRFIKKN